MKQALAWSRILANNNMSSPESTLSTLGGWSLVNIFYSFIIRSTLCECQRMYN